MITSKTLSMTHDSVKESAQDNKNRLYEKPVIISYAEDEILDLIGPACTCASSPGFEHHHQGHGNRH